MWCETFRYFMGAQSCLLLLVTFVAICHTYNIWFRASTIPMYAILSSSSIEIQIWLTSKKIFISWFVFTGDNVSQIMFILYGLSRTNKSLKFGHHLLSTSMEQYGKMLWRNSEFLIKWNWRLIIWDILGPHGLNIAINMTLFSKYFSTFLSTSCLGIKDTFKFKLNLSCFGFFNVNLMELKNFRAIFSLD